MTDSELRENYEALNRLLVSENVSTELRQLTRIICHHHAYAASDKFKPLMEPLAAVVAAYMVISGFKTVTISPNGELEVTA